MFFRVKLENFFKWKTWPKIQQEMIITPLSQAPQPSSQNREDEALIKANENLDDDSRHWPKETETFATSECTRISNEDLGKFHADLEAGLRILR